MRLKRYTVLLLIILLGLLYQFKYVNEFPSHVHAWAQSDRYALSLGFLDNGLNFFKPQTFVYNHQFPDKWKVPSDKSITAVDFPIHDYIPALLMKISGNTSPWVFRMYILFYSFLGLFFLFKLSYAVTKDYIKSVFVLIFAATSPLYVYYQGSFLPTIPSLSNAIIGIYFYYRYVIENKNKDFRLSMLFLTLAALSRTTFAIPIVAVLAIEFIRLLKKETNVVSKLIPACVSIFALLSYLMYNGYLREKYGSIFLNHILPPDSIGQAKEIVKYVYENWFFQCFTSLHYVVFVLVILLTSVFFVIRKVSMQKTEVYFGLLTATYLLGGFIFACLMLRQFPGHDYYFLDSFFLPIIMSLIFILSLIPSAEKRNLTIVMITAVGIISSLLILQPIKSQEKRRETGFWDRTEATINNYKNASAFLDSLGISKNAKILVLDAVAPNIPFILMQRKGFAVMNPNRENVEEALKWDYDYIVVQNEYFIPEIYTHYPGILSKLHKIGDNGNFSVCTLSDNHDQSLLDFIGLNKKEPVYAKTVTFENKPDSLWQNFNPSYRYAFSGASSGHLTSDIVYGLTYKSKYLPELKNNARTLLFSSYFLKDTVINCEIVVSMYEMGQNVYYKSYNLKNLIKQDLTWEQVSLLFQLPKIQSDDYEFAIFICNTGKSALYYDDFGFSIY
jgi:hypothetical protein